MLPVFILDRLFGVSVTFIYYRIKPGVASVLVSNVEEWWFDTQSAFTKDNEIGIFCFLGKHVRES